MIYPIYFHRLQQRYQASGIIPTSFVVATVAFEDTKGARYRVQIQLQESGTRSNLHSKDILQV